MLRRVSALLLPLAAAQSWETIELYDVLAAECGPIDDHSFSLKDYGDAAGDVYFAIRSVLPPLLCETCRNEPPTRHSLCVRFNGIAVGTCFSEQAHPGVQVARKVAVEVPVGHTYGAYGACNPPENANTTEALCTYECVPARGSVAPAAGIGAQRLTEEEICPPVIGQNISNEPGQERPAVQALHYDYNLCTRLDGHWYSVGNVSAAGTLWRNPTLVKAIDSSCQMRLLHETVQQFSGTACFDACTAPPVNGTYNITDPCYISCFYDTLLGPDAGNNNYTGTGGMTSEQIQNAWLRGFDECPDYNVTSHQQQQRLQDVHALAQRKMDSRGRRTSTNSLLPS